jgi:hypothetical protein
LIRARDSGFAGVFDEFFATEGVRVIRAPIRTTVAHADAERLVQTVRRECLDWLLIDNGLGLRPPDPAAQPDRGPVQRRGRLDGLLHEYY